MRQLSLSELEDQISKYEDDIKYCSNSAVTENVEYFMRFLFDQNISKRILDQISEDFNEIRTFILVKHEGIKKYIREYELKEIIKEKQDKGACAYFLLSKFYSAETNKYGTYYTNIPSIIGHSTSDYQGMHDDFNEHLITPFIDLLNWYINESTSRDSENYFSSSEINIVESKLDEIISEIKTLKLGQEIIFNEIDFANGINDSKTLLEVLKRKDWTIYFNGKLNDMVEKNIIDKAVITLIAKEFLPLAQEVYKHLT